jgi:predicted  nucleic acid-binding Zn-ribbon protein
MLLTILLSLALLAVAGVAGSLYYREVVRNRTRSLIPPVVGVTPGSRPGDHPESVSAWTAPEPERVTHVEAEVRETLAAAEAEARLIMNVATNAARAILEEAEATKRQAAGELAAARAKEADEITATRGRLDIVRRQCIEELATLETRKRELAGECRQMQELHDLLKADLAQIEGRVRGSLSSADDPGPL